ncbi:MAG: chromosomal replication initiator protein DnaA [bacterium]|nr:chromosomal replication initiator protein DnaA [bacterium]
MSNSPSDHWAKCLRAIRNKIQPQSFETWFGPTQCTELGPDKSVIEVPTSFFADWLEEHYTWLIRTTIEEETTWKPTLEFVVITTDRAYLGPVAFTDNSSQDLLEAESPNQPVSVSQQTFPAVTAPANAITPVFPLNPRYTFDNFVVGDSNEFSFTAAKSVAESPGQTAFNPLVIYSDVGLGKTHLLQAIGDYCVRNRTAKKIVYVTAEKFFSDYLEAIQKQDTSEYVKIYRHADVLLIDDIQFYVKTEGCQRELIHTFNTLYQNQKQIILSSDRPPSTLKGFEDRLISRFQWGLVTDISTPDLETRIAILNRKAKEHGVVLPHNVALSLAEQVNSNIRELEGALIRVISRARHRAEPLSVDLVKHSLEALGKTRSTRSPISIEQIQKATAGFFQVSQELLVGSTRKQEIAIARHVSMYLCKALTGAPLKTIGSLFGNRDHSTVIHACRNVEQRVSEDPGFEGLISQLREQIQRYSPA